MLKCTKNVFVFNTFPKRTSNARLSLNMVFVAGSPVENGFMIARYGQKRQIGKSIKKKGNAGNGRIKNKFGT